MPDIGKSVKPSRTQRIRQSDLASNLIFTLKAVSARKLLVKTLTGGFLRAHS